MKLVYSITVRYLHGDTTCIAKVISRKLSGHCTGCVAQPHKNRGQRVADITCLLFSLKIPTFKDIHYLAQYSGTTKRETIPKY